MENLFFFAKVTLRKRKSCAQNSPKSVNFEGLCLTIPFIDSPLFRPPVAYGTEWPLGNYQQRMYSRTLSLALTSPHRYRQEIRFPVFWANSSAALECSTIVQFPLTMKQTYKRLPGGHWQFILLTSKVSKNNALNGYSHSNNSKSSKIQGLVWFIFTSH